MQHLGYPLAVLLDICLDYELAARRVLVVAGPVFITESCQGIIS